MKRFLPLLAVALVGCVPLTETGEQPPTEQPPADDTDSTRWPSVTDKAFVVDPPTAAMCAMAPTPESIRRHQEFLKEEHGPHAVYAIVVRVNPTGREAFLARKPVPVGTVVVKEKLTDRTLVAVGMMTKREPGYDPENGDWEYSYQELKAGAPPPAVGKIDSCIACHRTAKQKDYLFRPYLSAVR